jgi:hypothetical protein
MDNLGQEYDVFQRDLNKEMEPHPLVSRIDEWERESMNKIKQVAEQARIDLRKLIDQNRKDLKTSMKQLTNELQSSRDSEDYTEHDLKRWLHRLKELRNELEKPLALNVIDDDDKQSVIRLIKVNEQLDSCSSNQLIVKSDQNCQVLPKLISRISEKFERIDKKSVLSENGLVATCVASHLERDSTIRGVHYYWSDIHHIRFRIEQKNCKCMFFGITTKDQANSQLTFAAPSANGWWELDCYTKDGRLNKRLSTITIQTGDEITLVLDCDHSQIHFKHHRTQQTARMSIDLQKCPFPWQILITLNAVGDCVRILDNNDVS